MVPLQEPMRYLPLGQLMFAHVLQLNPFCVPLQEPVLYSPNLQLALLHALQTPLSPTKQWNFKPTHQPHPPAQSLRAAVTLSPLTPTWNQSGYVSAVAQFALSTRVGQLSGPFP